MSYPEWRETLFENTFPRMRFENGSISWRKDGRLTVQWDGQSYILDPETLYDPTLDPVDAVLNWTWRNLPLASWEHSVADLWWSDPESGFRAAVSRSPEVIYSQSVTPHQSFLRFGAEPDKNRFSWGMEGGLLAVRSHAIGVPALCPLSHPISLHAVMEEFFEDGDDILVATPVHDPQYAFIGHRTVVSRIGQEDRGVLGVPVTQWKRNITKALEGR